MNKIRGFTLIEVLIALTIFAILATITSTSLMQAFKTEETIDANLKALDERQLGFSVIEQDIAQIIVRSIYVEEMLYLPPLLTTPKYFEFTVSGYLPPQYQKSSQLKRIAYQCKKDKFIRKSWFHLDSVERENFSQQILFDHLSTCRINYIDDKNQILNHFAPRSSLSKQLPNGLSITLEKEHEGKIAMIFAIAGGLYG
jgi:general secretion pathway protein J